MITGNREWGEPSVVDEVVSDHEEDPIIDRDYHDPEHLRPRRRFDQHTSGLTRIKMDRWQTSLSVLVFATKVFASTATDDDDPCVFILL